MATTNQKQNKNNHCLQKKKKDIKLESLVPPAEQMFPDHLVEISKVCRDAGERSSYSLQTSWIREKQTAQETYPLLSFQ